MNKPDTLSIGDNVSVSFAGEIEGITQTDNERKRSSIHMTQSLLLDNMCHVNT